MSEPPTTALLEALFPYSASTGDIVVRVNVSYMADQSAPADGRWFWAYHVRIENHGEAPVQLLGRHWVIEDGDGARHEVAGEGVIGEVPVIAPGKAHDYVSGCPLDTPSGTMRGHYEMIGAGGDRFRIAIPLFDLEGPSL